MLPTTVNLVIPETVRSDVMFPVLNKRLRSPMVFQLNSNNKFEGRDEGLR